MGGSQHLDHGSTTSTTTSHRDRTPDASVHEAPLVMGVGDGSIFTPNTSGSPMMRQAFLRGGDDDDAFGSTGDIEELNNGGHKRDRDEQELQLQLQQQEEEDNASPTAVSNVSNDGDDTQHMDTLIFGLSKYHILVLISTWLGWSFDIYDGVIFSYAAPVCVPMLLGYSIEQRDEPKVKQAVALWTAILTAILLIGWAVGGIVFGIITDRLGRSRAMMLTILCYSIATSACAFSFHIAFLGVFRFLSALGIGGEWAAGSSLIAEALPHDKRVIGGVFMYTAAPVGAILAYGVTFLLTSSYTSVIPAWLGWRIVFATGVIPSLLGVFIRHGLKEPDSWKNSVNQRSESSEGGGASYRLSTFGELFSADLRWKTVSSLLLVIFALIPWYSGSSFISVTAIYLAKEKATASHMSDTQLDNLKDWYMTIGVLAFNIGGLLGTVACYPIAQRLGRVWLFRIYFFFSALFMIIAFSVPMPGVLRLCMFFPVGIFVFGIFAAFTFYLPELFPTAIRGTGCGFSYNTGRLITAAFPFVAGVLLSNGVSPVHVLLGVGGFPCLAFLLSCIPRALEETKHVIIQ